MSKRKMRCQILHLEDLAKRVNKLWHWYPDRLLSQGTENGKWKVYWFNKLIFKSKSGFSRLIASYTESKFSSPRQSLNLYICSTSPPQPVKPFCLPQGEAVTLISRTTPCAKGQESWIILQKSVLKLPPGILNSNVFKHNSAKGKSQMSPCWLSTPINVFLPAPVRSLSWHNPVSQRTGFCTGVRNPLPKTGFVCQISVKGTRNNSPFWDFSLQQLTETSVQWVECGLRRCRFHVQACCWPPEQHQTGHFMPLYNAHNDTELLCEVLWVSLGEKVRNPPQIFN